MEIKGISHVSVRMEEQRWDYQMGYHLQPAFTSSTEKLATPNAKNQYF